MYNYASTLVAQLNTILPTHYELFVDSNTSKPCITYKAENDETVAIGDTLGYSRQSYYVKLWGDTKANMATYASQIDNKMRQLGFERISYNELAVDTQLCYIWLYRGLAKENFN